MKMIDCVVTNGFYRITLNRADKANSLNRQMLHDLLGAVEAAAKDDELRGLVLTGAGEKVFCAGADLSELKSKGSSADEVRESNLIWEAVTKALADLPVMTIAALNGSCIGGGLNVALACDVRVCVPNAIFFYPVLKNGVLPMASDVNRFRDHLGISRTKALLMGGQRIDVETAHVWGMIDMVTQPEDMEDKIASLFDGSLDADLVHIASMKRLCDGDQNADFIEDSYRAIYDHDKEARRRLKKG